MSTQAGSRMNFQDGMRERYLADLGVQESHFRQVENSIRAGTISADEFEDLKSRAHKLAGNGATFGFPEISRTAAALEAALELQPAASSDDIAFHLDALIDACAAGHLLPQADSGQSKPQIANVLGPSAPELAAPSPRPKVLIVDDDVFARDALADFLLGEADIMTATSAAQALNMMLESPPDLLLLDDHMPGDFSGLQLQEKIREIESLRSVPTIMITASGKSESVMRALTAGAVDYIVKPLDKDKVAERLRSRLQRLSKSVFVVDDDRAICDLLSRKFASAGYAVTVFADGQSALDKIAEDQPNLVILDMMLPGLDGTMVLRKLRENEVTRDIPVVILSARGRERDIVSSFDLGATDYVVKPFNPQELAARCVRLLEQQSRSVA